MKIKTIIGITLCCGMLFLSACGSRPTDEDPSAQTEPLQTTSVESEEATTYVFDYMTRALPKGWTIRDRYCTSTYLEADWGEGEKAPRLIAAVYAYQDDYGFGKAEALAAAVQAREKNSSDITHETIGGMDFCALSFPSPEDKTLLRYEFYGQTEPDEKQNYTFITVTLDRVTDEKQYAALHSALDVLDFPFGQAK